ncbi:UDP-2,3-diacetamido-2,3-dideoxy-D-glucuronate 2-epimerase [Nitrospira tepida]|uniref:UDP-2,3-diacetamido-2,3-dideoxy-D-glucuronate 2-epimerase n=1 Tax=Nitrospira tepida TaxID=2973512 RepID=A0AA86N1A1_9BACT|nr:UDP-N-acetylglucosamine 2-epimerase (non-hydrolyzing) [Nitrospira tepida]CAI4032661.1 UDP-2,3-diacetamido-2,3-dideoxy-D-glucuronate 2-epimerase [Nitrospira tepida]
MNVMSIVGARPQFIKAAVVSRALRRSSVLHETLVHTGQHYDDNMSAVFFDELGIAAPDHHLGIGSHSQGVQTARMLEAIESLMVKAQPDRVLVYGDTNSTLAGALAAAKLHIPVAHVEAGLRSFNRRMPEEINRIVTDHLSTILFAPTTTAVEHLRCEGVPGSAIKLVGDVMYDAALYYAERATAKSAILSILGLKPGEYCLVTVHRAENTDAPDRLRAIVEALAEVAGEMRVVVPLHPRTRQALARIDLLAKLEAAVTVLDPVGYLDMISLEKHAQVIATDSGGVQKEAFFYRVPCVTLRDETEWVELLDLGWNRLAPPSSPACIRNALLAPDLRARGRQAPVDLYGGGEAVARIVACLEVAEGWSRPSGRRREDLF